MSIECELKHTHLALLADTKSIADVDVATYDGIFVTGGQSPMVTFRGNAELQALVARFHEAGKVTALVCHGTCLLLETRLGGGELLVTGKTWTGSTRGRVPRRKVGAAGTDRHDRQRDRAERGGCADDHLGRCSGRAAGGGRSVRKGADRCHESERPRAWC